MNNPESLAKLIKEVPELAGKVVPEGVTVGLSGGFDSPRIDAWDLPSGVNPPESFYQAVAGNLAEWAMREDINICPREDLIDECAVCASGGQRHRWGMWYGPTVFAALVEAAIAVSK